MFYKHYSLHTVTVALSILVIIRYKAVRSEEYNFFHLNESIVDVIELLLGRIDHSEHFQQKIGELQIYTFL